MNNLGIFDLGASAQPAQTRHTLPFMMALDRHCLIVLTSIFYMLLVDADTARRLNRTSCGTHKQHTYIHVHIYIALACTAAMAKTNNIAVYQPIKNNKIETLKIILFMYNVPVYRMNRFLG